MKNTYIHTYMKHTCMHLDHDEAAYVLFLATDPTCLTRDREATRRSQQSDATTWSNGLPNGGTDRHDMTRKKIEMNSRKGHRTPPLCTI